MKNFVFLAFLCLCLFPQQNRADEVQKKIEKPVEKSISIMQQTQKDEADWHQLQEKLATELELLQTQIAQLTDRRDWQKEQISQTQKRISSKQQQLADIKRIEQELDPFLAELVTRLTKVSEQGLPFQLDERKQRIAKVENLLHDPDITISEKYRKAMEALQIEANFGVTIETYQQMIEQDNQKILVNILRLGRLGLYYVTLDEGHCGFFNIADNHWQLLPEDYVYPLQTAVAIASKQRPAEFIDMPLGRMVR